MQEVPIISSRLQDEFFSYHLTTMEIQIIHLQGKWKPSYGIFLIIIIITY